MDIKSLWQKMDQIAEATDLKGIPEETCNECGGMLEECGHGMYEGEMSSRIGDKGETIRKHTAKAGGYGRKIDTPDDSGDKFHSSDIDDTDDAPAAQTAVKRGRGRPMKGGDSETGQVKQYDTDALASWIIGNKPKNMAKIGTVSKVHRLKEYMSQVETNKLFEGVIAEGKMREVAAFLQDILDEQIDIYDIIVGKYKPVDAVEKFVVDKLKQKYEEYTRNTGDDGGPDAMDQIYSELEDIISGSQPLEEVMATTTQPAAQQTQQQVPVRVNGQVVGMAPNQAAAQQATQKMTQNANNQKELAKLGVTTVAESKQINESAEAKYQIVMEGMTLEEILDLHPHEHKMCQEGWGMDESLYEALCDHYFKEGRIPRKVWHGPLEELRDFVEECYLKDTQTLMDESSIEETAPITSVIDATYADPGVDEGALRTDDHAMTDLLSEIDEEFDTVMKNSGIPREPIRGFVPPEEESVFSKNAMMKDALNESKSEKKPDQQWRNSLVTSKTVKTEAISQDDFDKAALAQGKRGRDARDNPEKAVALAKKSPASREAGAKVAAYKAKHDEPVKKLAEKEEKWIAGAIKHPGAFTKKAKSHGMTPSEFAKDVLAHKEKYPAKTEKQAVLAKTLKGLKKEDVKEGKFSTMDADLADMTPKKFKEEYGMTKAEARAKHGAKKESVKESHDFSQWDQQLNSLLNEDLTVNTTSSSNPESNSVNVSATAEDAENLMALLKNAGMGADDAVQSYDSEDTGACEPGEMEIEVSDDGNEIADIVKRMMGAQSGNGDYAIEVMEDFEPNIYTAAEDSYQKDDGAVKQTKTTAKGQDGKTYDGTGSPALTTKTPGSDPHNKFHDASDVPVMAMPRGMGVSQNVEDEVAEVVEPIFIDEVIDGLENEESSDNGEQALDYIKKSVPKTEKKDTTEAVEEAIEEGKGDGNLANNAKPYDKVTQGDVIAGRLGKDEEGGKNVKEGDITTMANGDNDEEQSEVSSDAVRDAALAGMQPMGATNECEDEPKRERESLADFMKRLDSIVSKHPEKQVKLDEWANSSNNEGSDESFETDMEFMTKSISGGLNNQKQDQTLVGSGPNRVVTQDERKEVDNTIGAMLRKLDGING